MKPVRGMLRGNPVIIAAVTAAALMGIVCIAVSRMPALWIRLKV